jgi:hypothetical protein
VIGTITYGDESAVTTIGTCAAVIVATARDAILMHLYAVGIVPALA